MIQKIYTLHTNGIKGSSLHSSGRNWGLFAIFFCTFSLQIQVIFLSMETKLIAQAHCFNTNLTLQLFPEWERKETKKTSLWGLVILKEGKQVWGEGFFQDSGPSSSIYPLNSPKQLQILKINQVGIFFSYSFISLDSLC